jgi:hypothetical protein
MPGEAGAIAMSRSLLLRKVWGGQARLPSVTATENPNESSHEAYVTESVVERSSTLAS